MTRSRLVVFASMLVVGVGAVAALGALYLDPARAAVGPLEAEALALPADSRFVIGLDVQRFVKSPFYGRFSRDRKSQPDAFGELEEKFGLNPERDLDRVILAGRSTPGGKKEHGVALITGRFDRYKLGRAAEERSGVTTKNHQGTSMYLYNEETKGATAVAFLDDTTIVLGSQANVENVIANRAAGSGGLRGNAALLGLIESVKPGSTFWMAGDQTLLSSLPQSIPGGAGGTGMQLPALRSMVVTGDLDPVVALQITGETADAAAAQNVADLVRGLVAMASLQAQQKPELQKLASAVSVTTEAQTVRVNARFPYELLDSLKPAKRGVAAVTPTR